MTCTVPDASGSKPRPPLPTSTFEFKQFYMGCLAQASYLLGSEGEAAIVDPRRDVDLYIDEAKARGLSIRYVIETHLHADFVSGHRELAARTGATVLISHRANAAFTHHGVKDGDTVAVGALSLRILETPGHTPESISILVTDTKSSDKP
jgi:hydroxyacylglutathione hydrolase